MLRISRGVGTKQICGVQFRSSQDCLQINEEDVATSVRFCTPYLFDQSELTRLRSLHSLQLTLETVFLTHLVGLVMVVLFLSKRTSTNAFWILLELVTELYALSVLFTLNSRQSMRQSFVGTRGGLRTIPMTQPGVQVVEQPVQAELSEGKELDTDSGHFEESDDLERGRPASDTAGWSTIQEDVV